MAYLVIKTWLKGFQEVPPAITYFERSGGWDSVESMQSNRMRYYSTSTVEVAERIPGGIRIRWRSTGERHQEVTIE